MINKKVVMIGSGILLIALLFIVGINLTGRVVEGVDCGGADFDGDFDVDLDDFVILQENFGCIEDCVNGDADGDGEVDLDDYLVVKTNLGKTGCVASVEVPVETIEEPEAPAVPVDVAIEAIAEVEFEPQIAQCYMEIVINETKIGEEVDADGTVISQDIEFKFATEGPFGTGRLNEIYGFYGGLVREYDPEVPSMYILEVIGLDGSAKNYSLSSGRFAFWDDFENQDGGIIEFDSATITAIVPYGLPYEEPTYPIESLAIYYDGEKTQLSLFAPYYQPCEPDCYMAGFDGSYSGETRCCPGLVEYSSGDTFSCGEPECGNDICATHEDEYTCPEDCLEDFFCAPGYIKEGYGCVPDCMGADMNNDTKVDLEDFTILKVNFGRDDCAEPDWCSGADTNNNTAVDLVDFGNFKKAFGMTDC